MYATIADMIARYGLAEMIARTDDGTASEPPAEPVAAVIEPKLRDASAMVDDYLRARYQLPLAQPYPLVIVAQACALARYGLWQEAATERVKDDRDAAMAWLRDLSRGLVHIDAPLLGTAPATIGALVSAPAPIFTDDTLRGFTEP